VMRTRRPRPAGSGRTSILSHMNAGHVEAMVLLAKLHAEIDTIEAAMSSVDRLASLFG
jgi:hypothetical protein